MSKIDCNNIKNFFAEKNRMCEKYGGACAKCQIFKNKPCGLTCGTWIINNPDKAVEIVQKWSDEHPQETMLEHFFKQHPNAPKDAGGMPRVCPHGLGYANKTKCTNYKSCLDCWSRPYVEQVTEECTVKFVKNTVSQFTAR